jgi:hypothetical protein
MDVITTRDCLEAAVWVPMFWVVHMWEAHYAFLNELLGDRVR